MFGRGFGMYLGGLCAFVLSLTLLFSLALHTLQIDHHHYGEKSHVHEKGDVVIDTLTDYLHATEKKLFVFVLCVFLLANLSLTYSIRITFILKDSLTPRIMRLRSSLLRYVLFLYFYHGVVEPKYH